MPSPLQIRLRSNIIEWKCRHGFCPDLPPKGWCGDLESKELTNLELHDSRISCYRVLQRYVLSTAFLIA